ncbi:MAG: hypothetical protein HKP12_04535 [Gammaproteobacteria bacterium]|nr:hypothetical protein [Gammaproteobacteria bacterium]
MKKVSIGIALLLAVFLDDAISEGFIQGGASLHQRAGKMVIAASGGNPWALPDPRQQRGQLPEYVTNPRYVTPEDIETNLNFRNSRQNTYGQSVPQQQYQQLQPQQQQYPQQQLPQQQLQPSYGSGMALPQIPYIYAPYSGMMYGYQPGYSSYPALPSYPGLGAMPGLGTPYTGNITGFGGNPLVTPYGNIYNNVTPYQQTVPSMDGY